MSWIPGVGLRTLAKTTHILFSTSPQNKALLLTSQPYAPDLNTLAMNCNMQMSPCSPALRFPHGSLGVGEDWPPLSPAEPNPLNPTVDPLTQRGHTALLRQKAGLRPAGRTNKLGKRRKIRYHQRHTLHCLFLLYLSFLHPQTSPPTYSCPLLITFFYALQLTGCFHKYPRT